MPLFKYQDPVQLYIQGKWRISEKALIIVAVIGGSIGALVGMYAFHHKTRHGAFRYGIPLILIGQILLAWIICNRFWS